mmetsp:Transcript_6058/g.11277  ORF Transcript_6058/g.11277 Transcript_6058/m.11277 type:complete len:220 (+) Transcript_6058:211-870(+)
MEEVALLSSKRRRVSASGDSREGGGTEEAGAPRPAMGEPGHFRRESQNLGKRKREDALTPSSLAALWSSSRSHHFPKRLLQTYQRNVVLLHHAFTCSATSPAMCWMGDMCAAAQSLQLHINSCRTEVCTFPGCYFTKVLLHQCHRCANPRCPTCDGIRAGMKYGILQNLGREARSAGNPYKQVFAKLEIETIRDIRRDIRNCARAPPPPPPPPQVNTEN